MQITSEGREHSDLTYNLQTDCGLTIVGREQSDLMYNLQTDYGLTVVGRELLGNHSEAITLKLVESPGS